MEKRGNATNIEKKRKIKLGEYIWEAHTKDKLKINLKF